MATEGAAFQFKCRVLPLHSKTGKMVVEMTTLTSVTLTTAELGFKRLRGN